MSIRRKRQSGLAAVETMIAAPLVFMMLAISVDLGRAFVQYTMLNKAVQNGARYAITEVYKTLGSGSVAANADIKKVVVYGLNSSSGSAVINGLTTGNVTVNQSGKYVVVTVSYQYSPVFLKIPYTDFSVDLTLSASSAMRTGV